jgi:uncharacterized protein (UPF0335 family)
MNLNDFYVLVDTETKQVIDKIQKLPENWKNIAGLPRLSDEELCDLKWAGHDNLGWVSIASNLIKDYKSPVENLELNKNTLKQLISEIRKEKEFDGIKYQEIKIKTDEKTRYSLLIKKLQGIEEVNYKFFNHYYTFTNSQITEICDIIETHIQKCFDWEMSIYLQIENCKELSDFMNIKL